MSCFHLFAVNCCNVQLHAVSIECILVVSVCCTSATDIEICGGGRGGGGLGGGGGGGLLLYC